MVKEIIIMDTKNKSLAAMIFGICGIAFAWIPVDFLSYLALPCAIVAIVLASISLKQIKAGGDDSNKGMAIAGLVCGIVSCASAVISIICVICALALVGGAIAGLANGATILGIIGLL